MARVRRGVIHLGAMATLVLAQSYVARIYSDFLRTFSNVLFAVILFAVWGLMTLIGVIVDQGKDPNVYFANYSLPLARLILRMGLDNIYHSPAYVGIIGLILLSLAVCTFKRVIPARLPPLRAVNIEHNPLHAYLDLQGDEQAVRSRIDGFFSKRGWQVRKKELGGTEWTFADRHNWARRGVLVAHIGFVIIAAGTSIYWARGFSGETAVLTGEILHIPRTGATLELHNFSYRIDPISTKSGLVYQPIDYVSQVTVRGSDGISHERIIRVNHPIEVDNVLYYQASYGFATDFTVTHDRKNIGSLGPRLLKEGQALTLPGTARSIQYSQFAGTLDRRSGMPTADPRVNNPGVLLNIFDDEQPVGTIIAPIGRSVEVGGGYRITPHRYTIYSGLQYRYDPGIPLVGIGAFVLLAGLCISFYLLPARLYVRVEGSKLSWNVGIAATTVKGYDIFEDRFHELVDEFRRRDESFTHGS
ncbi:MAG: cytochrome c biogenesis protein ResB [Candidatus Eremiobacteraeota bacterium]|nr:cytochrome c biogenesis protein ResB [Candidatus Eremiobacteraeota bacterium]